MTKVKGIIAFKKKKNCVVLFYLVFYFARLISSCDTKTQRRTQKLCELRECLFFVRGRNGQKVNVKAVTAIESDQNRVRDVITVLKKYIACKFEIEAEKIYKLSSAHNWTRSQFRIYQLI